MAKDHTKSLIPYRKILTDVEKEYRDTSPNDCADVVERLVEEIKQAAEREGAEVADDEVLSRVRALPVTSVLKS